MTHQGVQFDILIGAGRFGDRSGFWVVMMQAMTFDDIVEHTGTPIESCRANKSKQNANYRAMGVLGRFTYHGPNFKVIHVKLIVSRRATPRWKYARKRFGIVHPLCQRNHISD